VRAGTVKAIAVMSNSRTAAAPDIPTVDEAGLPGLYLSGWYAVFAPKRTPKEIIAKLNAAVRHALADQGVGKQLADLGMEIFSPDQQTPEALAALQRSENDGYMLVIGYWGTHVANGVARFRAHRSDCGGPRTNRFEERDSSEEFAGIDRLAEG